MGGEGVLGPGAWVSLLVSTGEVEASALVFASRVRRVAGARRAGGRGLRRRAGHLLRFARRRRSRTRTGGRERPARSLGRARRCVVRLALARGAHRVPVVPEGGDRIERADLEPCSPTSSARWTEPWVPSRRRAVRGRRARGLASAVGRARPSPLSPRRGAVLVGEGHALPRPRGGRRPRDVPEGARALPAARRAGRGERRAARRGEGDVARRGRRGRAGARRTAERGAGGLGFGARPGARPRRSRGDGGRSPGPSPRARKRSPRAHARGRRGGHAAQSRTATRRSPGTTCRTRPSPRSR